MCCNFQCTSLALFSKIYASIFIHFDTIINKIVLITFLYCLLLVYRNTTNVCVLSLYPASCKIVHQALQFLQIDYLGLSLHHSFYLQIQMFTSFFSVRKCLFLFFFPLITLIRASNTMLKKDSENKYPILSDISDIIHFSSSMRLAFTGIFYQDKKISLYCYLTDFFFYYKRVQKYFK